MIDKNNWQAHALLAICRGLVELLENGETRSDLGDIAGYIEYTILENESA